MLDHPDHPDAESAAPPKKPRKWPLRGRGLKGGRKPRALMLAGAVPNIELIEILGEIGTTLDEVAVVFTISNVTLQARLKRFPELRVAYERGKVLGR